MKYLILGLLAVGLYFLVFEVKPTSNLSGLPVAENQAPKPEKPMSIGTLWSRQNTIHVYVGKYTIEDAIGNVLARLVNRREFSRLLPDVFSSFKHMYADIHTYDKVSNWNVNGPTSDENVFSAPKPVENTVLP